MGDKENKISAKKIIEKEKEYYIKIRNLKKRYEIQNL